MALENQETDGSENQEGFQAQNEIPHEKWFYFAHGRKAKDIAGLKKVLEKIDDVEFNHHVNDQRNDFANWVEHVFGEQELSTSMRKTYNKDDMHDVVADFLNEKQPAEEIASAASPSPAHRRHRNKPKEQAITKEQAFGEVQAGFEQEKEQEKILPAFEEHDYLTFDDKASPKVDHKIDREVEYDVESAQETKEIYEKKPEQHEEYPELPVIKPIDDFDDALPKGKEGLSLAGYETEPVAAEEMAADEKGLSDKELKKIVLSAKQALAEEESKKALLKRHEAELHHKFVVKEFIYGFVLGLIFGMMMLGVIINLGA